MPSRFKDLCLDASDHQALADWWCAALGYVRQAEERPRPLDWPVPIEDPVGQGPLIWIKPRSRAEVGEEQDAPGRHRR